MNEPTQPKKGMSTLTIVLIIVAVAFVLLAGTCAAAGLWVGHRVKEVKENIADGGGFVFVAPPEVVAELSGAKRDYVGTWQSVSGKSALAIGSDGTMAFQQAESGVTEKVNAPIAAFRGNDILVRLGIDYSIPVTQPPTRNGKRWTMVARGITFERDAD